MRRRVRLDSGIPRIEDYADWHEFHRAVFDYAEVDIEFLVAWGDMEPGDDLPPEYGEQP